MACKGVGISQVKTFSYGGLSPCVCGPLLGNGSSPGGWGGGAEISALKFASMSGGS